MRKNFYDFLEGKIYRFIEDGMDICWSNLKSFEFVD